MIERPGEGEQVMKRLDLEGGSLGFNPGPGCRVNMKFLEAAGRWTVYMLFDQGKAKLVMDWIEGFGPENVVVGPGLYSRVVRAEFHRLPSHWEWLQGDLRVVSLTLSPNGPATLILEGTHDQIKDHARALGDLVKSRDAGHPRLREFPLRPEQWVLTPRQGEVLNLAVSLGYYDVPHNVSLRDLAKRLDRSLGTVSELLRRAECAVISQAVSDQQLGEWSKVEKELKIENQGGWVETGR